jgi:hypothetical protein
MTQTVQSYRKPEGALGMVELALERLDEGGSPRLMRSATMRW